MTPDTRGELYTAAMEFFHLFGSFGARRRLAAAVIAFAADAAIETGEFGSDAAAAAVRELELVPFDRGVLSGPRGNLLGVAALNFADLENPVTRRQLTSAALRAVVPHVGVTQPHAALLLESIADAELPLPDRYPTRT